MSDLGAYFRSGSPGGLVSTQRAGCHSLFWASGVGQGPRTGISKKTLVLQVWARALRTAGVVRAAP